ncbi:hypothetical protein BSKO_05703 [Bryopsis sp. KO-2023]|nr:hypothetical protein BSKO_05703 [Bryopsis sp. KO-2023]
MGPGSVLSGMDFSQGAIWHWFADNHAFLGPILIWLFGAVFGFLLAGLFGIFSKGAAIIRWSPPGAGVRRAALMLHGFVLARDLWYSYFQRGTVRRFLQSLYAKLTRSQSTEAPVSQKTVEAQAGPTEWPVTEADLDFLKSRMTLGDGLFKKILDKELGDAMKYYASYRILPGNKTEYKSVTIARNATAEEMTDFYLDDNYRTKWDGMISRHQILENGPVEDRRQVVHWVRSFPVPCLTDREYVIARRTFVEGDTIYTLSKSTEHPDAPKRPDIVRMDEFYSMWSCRTIKCPWGSDQPACEVILFHHEQFKIPERLARFAACKGMWGFVKGLGPYKKQFVEERRKLCKPDGVNPQPYGYDLKSGDPARKENEDPTTPQNNRTMKRVRRSAIAAAATMIVVMMKPK